MASSMNWVDGSGGGTPLTAANLNKLMVSVDAGTAGTPTGDALRAGYAAAGFPSHAGTRNGRQDPGRSIYNLKASNTGRLRAALSAARAGTGLCRLGFAGDSLTAGYTATRGTTDPVTSLRGELNRQGYTTGELVHTSPSMTEPRITTTGTWAAGTVQFPWIGGTSTGATLALTGTGTVCEIVSAKGSAPFTYSIDGAAAVTVTPSTSPTTILTTTVTGLTSASHTVTITTTNTAGVYLYALGFRSATGVVVDNAGIVGASSPDWLAQPTNYGPAVSTFSSGYPSHDAVFLELGANNLLHAVGTPAGLTSDLGSLITQIRAQSATPATVVLVASNYMQTYDTSQPAWISAVYDAADASDVPLIDFADRLGLYGTYSGMQGAGDGIHLNPAGYAHKARAWWNAISA